MSRAPSSGLSALLRDFRHFAGARLWLALALMLLGAFAEGFGLLVIVPLASIAIGGKLPPRFDVLVDWAGPDARFLAALILFVAAMAARSVLLFARDLETAKLQTDYEASLRLRAAATLARRGWPFASRMGQAAMQSLLLNDVPRAGLAVYNAEHALIAGTMLAVQLALALILSPGLTLVALVFLGLGALLSVRWTRRGVLSGMAIIDTTEESTASGFRLHAGLKAALAQGTVPSFLDEYRTSLSRASDQWLRFAVDHSSARYVAALGAAVAAALLFYVGVRVLALPFAVLIASLALFARMVGPAQGLQQSLQQLAAVAPAFSAIERRLGSLEQAVAAAAPAQALGWTTLELKAAGFEHQPGLGLRNASLTLRSGEWLGIGGPSGAGKTTLADLVAGLFEPGSGCIEIDGRQLAGDTLERWRAGLAYVGQETLVFNDSVRGNLLAEGARADESALWDALDIAGLVQRVRALPQGLDESVGDRGSQLSGGERQRLAIARAVLRNPTLLILDEATAALDVEGETALLKRLRGLRPRRAALVVAHRPSTLAHCDSVVAIQHGNLEETA